MSSFASPSASTSLLPAFNLGGTAGSVDSPSGAGRTSRDDPSNTARAESYSPPTPAPLPPPPSHLQLNGQEQHSRVRLGASGSSSGDDEEGLRLQMEDGDLEGDQLHLGAAAHQQYSAESKGKQVMRDSAGAGSSLSVSQAEQDGRDELERQQMIDKVLKRAQIAKTTRNFMNRLALASYKAQRGWHDIALDAIESHLEQEAARRKQQQEVGGDHHQQQQAYRPHPPQYGLPPSHSPQGLMGPPPPSHNSVKRPRGGSMATPGSMMSSPAPNGHAYDQQRFHDQPYASSPFPTHHQQNSVAPPASHNADSRPQKRRHTNDPSQQQSYQSSPPAPRPPPTGNGPQAPATLPRSTANGRQQRPNGPLSSSDPTFSSFVDAATALTGLSRASSDPSVNSGEEGSQDGTSERRKSNGETATAGGERPRTPEAKRKDLAGAMGAAGAAGESSAEGAAELMLFLAASPSPVQVRTGSQRPALGEGMGMKGRRLFSNSGGPPEADDFTAAPTQSSSVQSVFGDHLSPRPPSQPALGASPTLSPFSTDAATLNSEPSKSSSQYTASASSVPQPPPASSTSMLGNGLPSSLPVAPGTPVRDRQPSGSNWESYLNVSPSPQRAPVDRERQQAEREAQGPRPVFGLQM